MCELLGTNTEPRAESRRSVFGCIFGSDVGDVTSEVMEVLSRSREGSWMKFILICVLGEKRYVDVHGASYEILSQLTVGCWRANYDSVSSFAFFPLSERRL